MTTNITSEVALSAAYMAMGYATVSATDRLAMGDASAREGWGQLETVGYLVEWAEKLEKLYFALPEEVQGSAPGVWPYEVPEPFGEWFAEQMLDGGAPSTKAMDEAMLNLVADFFTQCDGADRCANASRLLVTLRTLLESLS